MKTTKLIFGLAIFFFGLFPYMQLKGQDKEYKDINTLTIKETLGLAFYKGSRDQNDILGLIPAANPKAKPKLYRLLEKEHKKHLVRARVIEMIGYIGNKKDVQILNAWFNKRVFKGDLTMSEFDSLTAFFRALAAMSRTGNKAARSLLKKMASKSYWTQRLEKERITRKVFGASIIDHPLDGIMVYVLEAYTTAGFEDWRTKVKNYISKIQNKEVKKYMKSALSIETLRNYKNLEHFKYTRHNHPSVSDKLKKNLMNLYEQHVKNKKMSDTKGIDRGIERMHKTNKIGTEGFKQVGKSEQPQIQDLIKEGLAEFDKIKKAIKEQDKEKIIKHLLDDGDPVDPEDLKTSDEIKKDLSQLKNLIVHLESLDTEPVQFDIKKKIYYSVSSLDKKNRPEKAQKKEEIHVSFQLKGSETAVKKLEEITGGGTSRTVKGNRLIVVLKKMGKTWYWNPFGW